MLVTSCITKLTHHFESNIFCLSPGGIDQQKKLQEIEVQLPLKATIAASPWHGVTTPSTPTFCSLGDKSKILQRSDLPCINLISSYHSKTYASNLHKQAKKAYHVANNFLQEIQEQIIKKYQF